MDKLKKWIDAELDYSKHDYENILDNALKLKNDKNFGKGLLNDKVIYSMFFNKSLRTRISTSIATQKLGGIHIPTNPYEIYTPASKGDEKAYSTERLSDVSKVLHSMGDALAIRMYGKPTDWVYGWANNYMKSFYDLAKIPVINLECDKFHPTQALADLITLKEKFNTFKDKKFVMSWAYSKSCEKPVAVPQSVILLMTKMGFNVTLTHPQGFELDPMVINECKKNAQGNQSAFDVEYDRQKAYKNADVVYAKSWNSLASYNTIDDRTIYDKDNMMTLFDESVDWLCNKEIMSFCNKGASYMHCLPCDRNQEVTDEIIDGPDSLVFQQAENRLHAIKSVLSLMF